MKLNANYMWGSSQNDPGLSEGFAWLLNYGVADEDAHAVISKNDKGRYEWSVSLNEPKPSGFIDNFSNTVDGDAETMNQAMRSVEAALGIGIRPFHP